MPFTDNAKNQASNGILINGIRLHNGDPGASGAANQIGSLMAAAFNTAAAGLRTLQAAVNFTGLAGNAPVTWFSIWSSGTHQGRGQITSGDQQANAAGEYTLTTGLTIGVID